MIYISNKMETLVKVKKNCKKKTYLGPKRRFTPSFGPRVQDASRLEPRHVSSTFPALPAAAAAVLLPCQVGVAVVVVENRSVVPVSKVVKNKQKKEKKNKPVGSRRVVSSLEPHK